MTLATNPLTEREQDIIKRNALPIGNEPETRRIGEVNHVLFALQDLGKDFADFDFTAIQGFYFEDDLLRINLSDSICGNGLLCPLRNQAQEITDLKVYRSLRDQKPFLLQPKAAISEPSSESKEKKENSKHSHKLLQLVENLEVFHDADNESFVTYPVNSHLETAKIASKDFHLWLSRQFYLAEKCLPSNDCLEQTCDFLAGKARFEGLERDVSLRIAEFDGKIYVDLCNEKRQVVEISQDEWKVLDNSPVKFRRTKGNLALPLPVSGGKIADLRAFVNIADNDFSLLVARLVACFRPERPFPVLVLHGEQGTAKTTTSRVLKLLLVNRKANKI